MNLILCTDNKQGISFHHRRQSQDRILREQLVLLTGTGRLWMNSYSRKQFTDNLSAEICVDEDFLEKAGPEDYCFVENQDISSYEDQIKKLILFRWNRDYPADVFLTLDLSRWTLAETQDFSGFSHKTITKEIYVR